ncbi:MAG: transcription-repair coupling factor, partial [Nitrospiraceae bacterium]|nr:transcription-repair coupling factor [Nitrospiraceae bacterium]
MSLFPKFQERIQESLSSFVTQEPTRSLTLKGIEEDARSLLPFLCHDLLSGKTLWMIAGNIEKAHNRVSALLSFQSFFGTNLEICFFPEEEVLPYEAESPPDFLRAERIHALSLLARGKVDVVVTTWPAIVRKTLPPRLLEEVTWTLAAGETIERTALADSLVRLGFLRVLQVSAPGEFAVRGAILDLYSPAHPDPVRLEWDDDILSSIR